MSKEIFMKEALREARVAADLGEIPIGAVIVKDDLVIASGHNMTETAKDPTCHAEMNAIRQAAGKLGGWRLKGCTMYTTCEPCAMCAGAMVWARIDKVVIGAMDPKAGACGSIFNIIGESRLNHNVEVEYGVMEEECSTIMKEFFKKLREIKRNESED
jgi:tRNA(adenine34) deaminase